MSATASVGSKRKILVAIVGSIGLVVAAAVTIQMIKPNPASADQPGRASVGDSSAAQQKTQSALARVNQKTITYDQVAEEAVRRYGEEILENLINRMIIEQACEKQGVEVTMDEVNGEILKIAKKFNLSIEQWLNMLQAERKVTPTQYKQDIIWPMLALRKLAGGEVRLTKEDVQKAYEKNYGPRVKARILVCDNQRRAADVWEKAKKNPETFEQLVYQNSVDPASRPLGGAVPPIRKHSGHAEVERAAFSLKEGEVSGVIQIDLNQWVIIKCEGRTEQVVKSLEEVLPILKEELQEEKIQESVAKVFERIKAEARVDNYLTGVSNGAKKPVARPTPGQVQQTSGTAAPRSRAQPAGTPQRTTQRPAPRAN